MTTLEVKLNLPDQIAPEAQRAGLLNGRAIEWLIEEAVRREAGKKLLDAANSSDARATQPQAAKGESDEHQ